MNDYSDPAMVGSNFDRVENDFYPTPDWVTRAFITQCLSGYISQDHSTFWEPACGEGHISEVIKELYPNSIVMSTDIVNRGYDDQIQCVDFLKFSEPLNPYTTIITNPPYGKLLDPFIAKGLELIDACNGILALLMRNEVDSASSRQNYFHLNSFFAEKFVLLKRPRWVEYKPGDAAPRHNYSWFVWDASKKDGTFPIISYGK